MHQVTTCVRSPKATVLLTPNPQNTGRATVFQMVLLKKSHEQRTILCCTQGLNKKYAIKHLKSTTTFSFHIFPAQFDVLGYQNKAFVLRRSMVS